MDKHIGENLVILICFLLMILLCIGMCTGDVKIIQRPRPVAAHVQNNESGVIEDLAPGLLLWWFLCP